ncbi:hypothetical protein UPYG_G00193860 [Umbra pygmaea]|uniref:Galectin n=1 Tax=Umbra pygmaea TaxID=75934 RepID=A0ABD0WGZ3_UMBPY
MFVAPPGYQPVYNPCIPYLGPIYGGLRCGMSIYVQGVVPHHATRFHMNLQCTQMEGCDIGFHISPCFRGWDKVVFNHFQGDRWGSEEKTHHMPFRKGEIFEMVIIVDQECYEVRVNGEHFHRFNHRMPVESLNFLQISGDITIQTINVIGGGIPAGGYPGAQMGGGYPGGMGGGTEVIVGGGMGGGTEVIVGGGMGGGTEVIVGGGMGGGTEVVVGGAGGYPGGPAGYPGGQGGYPGGPGGYPGVPGGYPGGYPGGQGGYPGGQGGYPNEIGGGMAGQGYYPGGAGGYPGANLPIMGDQPIYNPAVPYSSMIPGGMSHKKTVIIRGMIPIGANRFSINFLVGGSRDIAFHMTFRVREREVVRNSMINQIWGAEEREYTVNPLQEGQFFDMSIRCGHLKFSVFVNGQHMCNFFHRFQRYQQIEIMEVDGDIQLSYIHF